MLRIILISTLFFIVYGLFAPLQAQTNDATATIDAVNFYFPPNAYKFKVSTEMKEYVKEESEL